MKKIFPIVFLFFLLFATYSCETKDDLYVPENLKLNDFIWKGMNQYYLWQEDVANLDDNRFANQKELNGFLMNYNNPVTLFNDLRINNSIDRFSVIYSDYSVLEGVLSGNTLNTGMDYGLRYKSGSTTDIYGWVRYVLPNSNAASQNVQRGMIFYAVNGTPLTNSNYRTLLANTSLSIQLADYDNGAITPNGQSISLVASALSENPVYVNTTFTIGSKKVGYLMYNGFYPSYEPQLNVAFNQLKSQGITDLILDLRYNSGGSIATATRLASMITGQFSGQLFAEQQWNPKMQHYWNQNNPANFSNYFTNTIGNGTSITHLNLSKIYILTSRSTASASELLINGLKPYIDVVQIGDKTTGKNVGSITLYDSPNFSKNSVNPNHRYAMQPIVLKVANASGFGDYQTGLLADYSFLENYGNLGEIGNANEPMLSYTLNLIANGARINQQNLIQQTEAFSDSKSMEPLRSIMYAEWK